MKLQIYPYGKIKTGFIFSILCLLYANISFAQPVVSLNPVITTGLSAPMQFVNGGDGSNRIFIVQKGGTIRAYNASYTFLSTFLTVSNVSTSGERGLLSMAFHPDYASNGYFYVYYTNTAGDLELARYQVSSGDPNLADASSKVILITIPHPTNANHNGGELHFGMDGFLYLSTGDGGGAGDVPNNAQNTTILLGKILRFAVTTDNIAPYYTIPAGNPFGNEIFALGLRNPYRWSFDSQNGDMWIGDVGQDSFEEIDYRPAASTTGANYGWRCYEGNATFNTAGCGPSGSYVFPAYNYPTQDPAAAITGGIVYRGAAYPALQGYFIGADFFSGMFYKIISNGAGGWLVSIQALTPTGIVDFGESENGEAYAVSNTGNSVFQIITSGVLPLTLADFTGEPAQTGVNLDWQTSLEENISNFELEYSLNGNDYSYLATVTAKNQAGGATYHYTHFINYAGAIFYRLKVVGPGGKINYSTIIKIFLTENGRPIVSPNLIRDGIMKLNLPVNSGFNFMEVVSVNGTVSIKKNLRGQTGLLNIPVEGLSKGIYFLRFSGTSGSVVQKILIQ